MAKKAELLEEAKTLKLNVSEKNTIPEIKKALADARAEQGEPKIKAKAEEALDGSTEKADQDQDKADDKEEAVVVEEPTLAKAGKRSAKGLKEAEEKAAKEERKANASEESEEENKPKIEEKRKPRVERKGKKFQEATKLIEKGKEYSTKEAIDLAVKTSTVNFDATVELHVKLGVDPKQADQNIRENIVLPEGSGKNVIVAVFGEADDVATAKKAGADIAGGDEFLQQLDKGEMNFDVLVSTPTVMKNLGKYARVLGPKGLMPNPKSGTVTKDVTKAIKEAKAGKVEIRVDEGGIAHVSVGKVSFGSQKLLNNVQAVFAVLKSAKPASVKANYVESIYVTSSMGPSIKVQVSEI